MLIENLDLKQDRFHLAEYADFETRDRLLVQDTHKESNELELKELVRKAQEYNQAAIDELYNRFKGMIINEIKVGYVKDALGEDAENIAWEIFYNAVQEVDVDETRCIPFILKRRVHSRLINEVKQLAAPWLFDSLDQLKEDKNEITDGKSSLETAFEVSNFGENIRKLSKDGQTLMKMLYVDGYSLEECSHRLGRTYNKTSRLKQKCLTRLKTEMFNH